MFKLFEQYFVLICVLIVFMTLVLTLYSSSFDSRKLDFNLTKACIEAKREMVPVITTGGYAVMVCKASNLKE